MNESSKNKLDKLFFKSKGLSDVVTIGKYTNCRIQFIAKLDPFYLMQAVETKMIQLNPHALDFLTTQYLQQKNDKTRWERFMTK